MTCSSGSASPLLPSHSFNQQYHGVGRPTRPKSAPSPHPPSPRSTSAPRSSGSPASSSRSSRPSTSSPAFAHGRPKSDMSERPRRRESARPPSTPSRRAFLLSRLGRERGYFFNVEEGTDGFLLLGGYGKTGSRQRCGTSSCRTCSTRSSRPRRSGTTTSTRASLALLGPLAPFYLFVRPGDLPKLPLQNHHVPHGPPLAGPEGARKRQVKAQGGKSGGRPPTGWSRPEHVFFVIQALYWSVPRIGSGAGLP